MGLRGCEKCRTQWIHRAERTLCSCIKVRMTCFNIDVQSVSAVPCTGLKVRLPSFPGAQQLTDLGMAFGTWCTAPIYLSPAAVTPSGKLGQKEPLGAWKATTDNTGGQPRLQGHLDSGCNGDTPVVLVTTAKGLKKLHLILCLWLEPIAGSSSIFWRQQQSAFQREANECDLHNQQEYSLQNHIMTI